MCKVQHFCDSVYHCIAKGYDRIDASKADAIDKIRKESSYWHLTFQVLFQILFDPGRYHLVPDLIAFLVKMELITPVKLFSQFSIL